MSLLMPRIKTWVALEKLYASDLNAEFDNFFNAVAANTLSGWSSNATQMRIQTTPGAQGSESLATNMSGELERLRFVINRLIGGTYWYDAPAISLTSANSILQTFSSLPNNRINSGKVRATSAQPVFITPSGSTNSLTIDCTPTPLSVNIDNVAYSFSADITFTGLTVAPGSNNTALLSDSLGGSQSSRTWGERGTTMTINTVGSEISTRVGQYAAFKIVNGTTEYFIARIASATTLDNIYRGFFFDSSDAPISRIVLTTGHTITYMRLTYCFITTGGAVAVTYNQPQISVLTPTSPAIGDYWFDLANNTWKTYNGSSFVSANATFIGFCFQDTTKTVGARCVEFYAKYSSDNSISVVPQVPSGDGIQSSSLGQQVSVAGSLKIKPWDFWKWSMGTDLDSGVTDSASVQYWAYITETGAVKISDVAPYNRPDLLGEYHPHNPWRSVGTFTNDGSSNIISASISSIPQKSAVWVQSANGVGSTNTAIMRFNTIVKNVGNAILYQDSSTLGATFTILEEGIYSIVASNAITGAPLYTGISINSTQLTTDIGSITGTDLGCAARCTANDIPAVASCVLALKPGDIVRSHCSVSPAFSGNTQFQSFKIAKVG